MSLASTDNTLDEMVAKAEESVVFRREQVRIAQRNLEEEMANLTEAERRRDYWLGIQKKVNEP